jgi:hypothetical protein
MICSSLCRVQYVLQLAVLAFQSPFTLFLLTGSACHLSDASFRDESGSGELTL